MVKQKGKSVDKKKLTTTPASSSSSKENLPKTDLTKWIKPKFPESKPKLEVTRSPIKLRKTRKTRLLNSPTTQRFIDSYFEKVDKEDDDYAQCTPPKRKTKFNSIVSPSAKFESKIPKIEDILNSRAELQKFKETQKEVEECAAKFIKESVNKTKITTTKKPKVLKKVKNCKHLTPAELGKLFEKDLKFLDDILYDRVPNERHELFKKEKPVNTVSYTDKDLRINESTAAFTQAQLVHLVNLFRERYDNGNCYKHGHFFFKVLLPEFCLKIFCDMYTMTNSEGLEYLKQIPIPNYLGC